MESWTPSIKRGRKVFFKSKSFKLNMLDWPCHVCLQKVLVWPTNKVNLGCVTNFYAQIWVMWFCVLYYQTIIFMRVFQWWTTYALESNIVLEMHFCSNSKKKPQSLGKNGCRQKCLDKSLPLFLDQWSFF